MYQQKLEDAMHEAHKPLARQRDDEDLDRMLRDKQREGDPMAAMLRKKKDRSSNTHGKLSTLFSGLTDAKCFFLLYIYMYSVYCNLFLFLLCRQT